MTKPTLLTIIIPVYNEASTIKELIARVLAADTLGLRREIIIVNDGSTDATSKLLNDIAHDSISIVCHAKNSGYGMAFRTALAQARGDIILTQDADLEHDPSNYPLLLEPIMAGHPVVYGSRLLSGQNRSYSRTYRLGIQFLTKLTNLLFDGSLTDLGAGHKAFRRKALEDLVLRSTGFEICPELSAKLLSKGVAILEVPVSYRPRTRAQGKKISWTDGVRWVWTLFSIRLAER
jgi:glycosyltransferase involved in cell wall biosynthesis